MKKQKLKQCTITLTRNCNLRCSFCYAKKTGYNRDFIAFAEVKRIIDICDEARLKYVVLTGGEPTLYPNLVETIQYIKTRKHNLIATIATNGTLLYEYERCKTLIDAGIDYIDLSLKGWDSESFSKVTGFDFFKKQLEAIKNLSSFDIDLTCSMVITPNNVATYCEAIEKAANAGAKMFSFTFVIDNEDSDQKDIEYLKNNNPFLLINAFLSQREKLDCITKGEWWIEYSFPMCVYTPQQLVLLKGKLAAPCQVYYKNGITFDDKMNLIPCSMNIEKILGTFGSDFVSYEQFLKVSNQLNYKSTIQSLNKLPSQYCKSCNYLKGCLGGCTFFWKHCSFDCFQEFKKQAGLMLED